MDYAKACQEILHEKLEEYIQTHKDWSRKGYLCPHKGEPKCHELMDEIMEDVEEAHKIWHIALMSAKHHDGMPHDDARHPEPPTHAGRRTPAPTNP